MNIILPGGKRIPARKRCLHCKRVRNLENFYRGSTGYYSSYCKDCRAPLQAKWAKKNPRKFAKTQERYFTKLKKLGVKRIRDLKKKKQGAITRPNPNKCHPLELRRNCNDAR